ncbi:hypothetical protein D7193_30430 [Micromonospora costi]|uniref:Uncharacterized protein n=2 Tax=Micromonospora costi TaxID=1530042 RepID=A0A3A9ZPN6_9ACTN|nr:hypothetical protein D7193_30430 [Micromonospora costi]
MDMPKALRTTALVVLLAAAAGCDSAAPTPTSTPASTPTSPGAFAAPPLRLPEGASGDACPTSEAHPWPRSDQAARVLGPGPVYPVADYLGGGAVLQLRDSDRQQDGTYEKKVRWIAAGYRGPVLVRAGRIDGPGSASATFSYTGEARDGGHYALLDDLDTDLPATTTVSGPGCYAYQVDGDTFSVTIVFRAVPATGPT